MEYGCAVYDMHTVNWTSVFERQAKAAGLSFDEIFDIAATIAMNPLAGDLIVGSGGARKLRHAGRNRGKSGSYRTIHYFAGDDVPIFLLTLIDKGQRANLSKAEVNELAKLLAVVAENYKKGRSTMSAFGKELLESAREAVAVSEMRIAPAGAIEFEAIDVAAIRKRLKLTQVEFAERFRLSLATIRDWEQKRRTPDRIAANLLRVIDRAPRVVSDALHDQ